ncbi:MAG: glycoside hydrolase family 25 protein [Lachnospiraceae bacterium]|nr:glycoside hydrolase family 25 protein [Lachnospiraceae bacterium]
MDSKWKRTAICVSACMCLLLLLLVLFTNLPQRKGTADAGGAVTSAGTQTDQDTGAGQQGADKSNLSAFLQDEYFFDRDTKETDRLYDETNRLSLIVTSVEKDLRVQIVDRDNKPVEGESFYITLNGKDEYKDLDKDGVIYIGDLPAGEYEVALKPISGYRTPLSATDVRVKDKVEYVAIDDISLLIKTEAEIDAEAEDSAEANTDGDDTEIRQTSGVSKTGVLGIDVSKWQKEIDWDKVKNEGVDFAIIRCGYRGSVTGSLVEDPYFEQNIKGARAAGIKVGVYFFTQAVNEVEAVEEASMVISLVRDYELQYPVFIDTEGAGGNGRADSLNVEERTAVCEAFCTTVKNASLEAGVYASRNWYNNKLTASTLESYAIWLAEYRSVPLYQGYYQMWQYTSKGKINGINGNVDLNVSYRK